MKKRIVILRKSILESIKSILERMILMIQKPSLDFLTNSWFVADYHFGDDGIRKTFHRPFKDKAEMRKVLIENTLKTVPKGNNLFFLGDFGSDLSPLSELLLHCNVFFILGNHDNLTLLQCASDDWYHSAIASDLYSFEYSKYPIMLGSLWLSHEPILVMQPECPYLNIHGHIHNDIFGNQGTWNEGRRRFNVSVEAINYKPISYYEIGMQIQYHL